jgi:hypothetical protein
MTPLEEAFCCTHAAWKEAWQMALDHNQPADVRREWERKRNKARRELEILATYKDTRSRIDGGPGFVLDLPR